MDGMRIVSLAYIHTTSNDQRSFFYLPASTRTPHRVRLLRPLCFHSLCYVATGGSDFSDGSFSSFSLVLHRVLYEMIGTPWPCSPSRSGARFIHPLMLDVLVLRGRAILTLSHIEPIFSVRLIASCTLSPSVVSFMCYAIASHAFIVVLCFGSFSPLYSVSLREDCNTY
jgi:hypothetical protein